MPDDNTDDAAEQDASARLNDRLVQDTEFDSGWALYHDDTDDSWYVARRDSEDSEWQFLNADGNTVSAPANGETDAAPGFNSAGRAQLVHKNRDSDTASESDGDATPELAGTEDADESPESDVEPLPESDRSPTAASDDADDLAEKLNQSNLGSGVGGDSLLDTVRRFVEDSGLFQGDENEDIASFDWNSEVDTARSKVERARAGDEQAKHDVRDMPRRVGRRFRIDPAAREDAIDALLPLTLSVSGFFLLLMAFLTTPGETASKILTTPSRYADLFVVSTVLMMVSAIGFWISRKSEGYARLRRGSRFVLGGLQLLPLGLFAILFGSFFVGTGLLVGFEQTWYGVKVFLVDVLPQVLVDLGYWYEAHSPLGMTIQDAAVLMLIVGGLSGIPFLTRVLKIALLAANEDPPATSSRRDVATLNRDHGKSDEGLKVGVDGMGGAAAGGVTEDSRWDDSVSALMALPDEMKSCPYKDYEEVRRYWVRAPYAYVSIVYNDTQNDYRYVVVEPDITDTERALIEEFDERLGTALLFEDIEEDQNENKTAEKVQRLEQKTLELAAEYNIPAEGETFHKLLYYLERNYIYYNKIDPFMNDPHVEDISCDGDGKYIFVFHQDYNDLMTNVKFERDELRSFIVQLAQRSGEHISSADPMCDASLPDGSRAQLTLGSEITTQGSTFTIRLFKEIPFTPVDLLKYGTFDVNQMAYLWLAIEHDKSLIFAGGTASGKTTSMNAVSLFIPPKAKVVTLEDTREINLPHDNWIPGTTRDSVGAAGGEEIDMYELLRAALRQRPEYMVVGEIRGDEAQTLFQAMSTGHTTYSTMHADSVQRAIRRLTNEPIKVPRGMVESLDIMCVQNQVRMYDEESGEVKNARRNETTREIIQMRDDGSFQSHQPYRRDPERDTFIEQLDDSHVLEEIREEQGWSREELEQALQERKDVLMYLVDNDITDFHTVARTIQAYMVDSETVAEAVENDTLEPESFKDITNVEFEADKTLREVADEEALNSEDDGSFAPDTAGADDGELEAPSQNGGDSGGLE